MKSLKIAVISLSIVALSVGIWFRYFKPDPTWVFHVRTGFREMPEAVSDRAMEEWLAAQPGVTKATVMREEKTLRIDYEFRNPSPGKAPGVTGKLRELGYRGPIEFTSWFDK